MAITYPTLEQITQRVLTDLQNAINESNPFLNNDPFRALAEAIAGRADDFYTTLNRQVIPQLFPDTATGEFLDRWGSYIGLTRNPATRASGLITVTGTPGTAIPLSTQFQNSDGDTYESTAAGVISAQSISIISLTRVGTTVTAITSSDHNLASNLTVVIAGAVETEYNGAQVITVTASDEVQYEIATTPTTPATGTITANIDSGSVSVQAIDAGQAGNADAGSKVTVSSPVIGMDDDGYVQFGSIGGGADEETEDEFSRRIIDAYRNPATPFNVQGIENHILDNVPGVTRVFIFEPDDLTITTFISTLTRDGTQLAVLDFGFDHNLENGMFINVNNADQAAYNGEHHILKIDDTTIAYLLTSSPVTPATGVIQVQYTTVQPGQVKILFTRDNDSNIIPDASEIATVKQTVLVIKPAHTFDADVIVKGPTPVSVPFTFAAISPDTSDMQAAIFNNLTQLFEEETTVGQDLTEDSYRSAIFGTIDVGGNRLVSFTLSTPTGDVTINDEEIPVLGSVTF